jgi:hypothetical protein
MGCTACARRDYTIVHWLLQSVGPELCDWLGLNTRTRGEEPACRMASWPLTPSDGKRSGQFWQGQACLAPGALRIPDRDQVEGLVV